MKTINLWYGTKSFDGKYDSYEEVALVGEELGKVRFTDEYSDIQYRVFRTEDDKIVVYFMERKGYDVYAELYEYTNLNEAKEHYAFILRKAGVI